MYLGAFQLDEMIDFTIWGNTVRRWVAHSAASASGRSGRHLLRRRQPLAGEQLAVVVVVAEMAATVAEEEETVVAAEG